MQDKHIEERKIGDSEIITPNTAKNEKIKKKKR
ncbi:hypothetical protein QG37_07451 [Candidozyma auris]|uniref:Uncharacterized protein n=1 Tax=Candidozyma auris TaxID=498019 RepID=A0A0L0NRL4_CANAR|nr:hypothetical protein QG37_07451 [[Candida] auris]